MRQVMALLAILTLLVGCSRNIDGSAAMGSREVEPSYFFAGDVDTYGQAISADEVTALAYLRAMRRVDPCGLITRESLAKIGEIGSVGTLFSLDECDIDIKVAGEIHRRYASIEVTLNRLAGKAVAFLSGDLPVYETYPGSCDYLLPLNLSLLPGARPLRTADQPFVRVGLVAEDNCDFAKGLVRAIGPRLEALQLPARDAVATYPARLAERDPCQVMSVISADIQSWDIGRSRPYECDFRISRGHDVVPIRLTLKPQTFDMTTETRQTRTQGGVELLVDPSYCSVLAFLGDRMQRKLLGGDFVDTGDVIIRPAVVVDSGGEHCDVVMDVAAAAAKLYG
ncbi:hypothetical protein [Mycobacterium sp. MMS18-G62]